MLRATDRCIHIAGGEAMLEYETLVAICRGAARYEGLPSLHRDQRDLVYRCPAGPPAADRLQAEGVRGLYISADAFHLALYPVNRYLCCYKAAVEVFGRRNVAAPALSRDALPRLSGLAAIPIGWPPSSASHLHDWLAAPATCSPATSRRGPSMTSRATTCGMTAHAGCPAPGSSLPTPCGNHLDPYGNVQTCCGVILGNVESTPGGLPEPISAGFPARDAIVSTLARRGRSAPCAWPRGSDTSGRSTCRSATSAGRCASSLGPTTPTRSGRGNLWPAWRVTAGRSPIRNPNSAIPIGAPDA